MTAVAYVGLGSNLSHPRRQIARALRNLQRVPGTRLLRVSPTYRSAPLGTAGPQPDYVNTVAALATTLAPRVLLARLLAIERRQLRRRDAQTPRNAARTLDLDLLLYGGRRVRSPALTIPHPRMHERAFVLRPLVDIAPTVRIAQRGLARRHLPALRDQRIVRTRSHYPH